MGQERQGVRPSALPFALGSGDRRGCLTKSSERASFEGGLSLFVR